MSRKRSGKLKKPRPSRSVPKGDQPGAAALAQTTPIQRVHTRADQDAFLDAFRALGNIADSARQAGIDRGTHYYWLNSTPDYPARFAAANEDAIERLEREARRRAVVGVQEPVVSGGQQVWMRDPETGQLLRDEQGRPRPLTVTRYSDRIMIVLLQAQRPHVYGRAMFAPQIQTHKHLHLYRSPEAPSVRQEVPSEGTGEDGALIGPDNARPVGGKVIVIRLGRGEELRTLQDGAVGRREA